MFEIRILWHDRDGAAQWARYTGAAFASVCAAEAWASAWDGLATHTWRVFPEGAS